MIQKSFSKNISKIVIGTAQFGMDYGIANKLGEISNNEMKEILFLARDYGIDTLDTAIDYGNCHAKLGTLGIKNWNVISKITNFGVENFKENTLSKIKNSLFELKIDSLDTLLLHNPIDLEGKYKNQIYDAIYECKKVGLCKKIGISGYNYEQIIKITSLFDLDIVQLPSNVFNRQFEIFGFLDNLKNKNIELHARSIFLQGILLMNKKDRHPYFKNWNTLFEEWDKWLLQNDISNLEACISYIMQIDNIDKIIIGIDSRSHLEEIIKSIEKENFLKIPDFLGSIDNNLINPVNWKI